MSRLQYLHTIASALIISAQYKHFFLPAFDWRFFFINHVTTATGTATAIIKPNTKSRRRIISLVPIEDIPFYSLTSNRIFFLLLRIRLDPIFCDNKTGALLHVGSRKGSQAICQDDMCSHNNASVDLTNSISYSKNGETVRLHSNLPLKVRTKLPRYFDP